MSFSFHLLDFRCACTLTEKNVKLEKVESLVDGSTEKELSNVSLYARMSKTNRPCLQLVHIHVKNCIYFLLKHLLFSVNFLLRDFYCSTKSNIENF